MQTCCRHCNSIIERFAVNIRKTEWCWLGEERREGSSSSCMRSHHADPNVLLSPSCFCTSQRGNARLYFPVRFAASPPPRSSRLTGCCCCDHGFLPSSGGAHVSDSPPPLSIRPRAAAEQVWATGDQVCWLGFKGAVGRQLLQERSTWQSGKSPPEHHLYRSSWSSVQNSSQTFFTVYFILNMFI